MDVKIWAHRGASAYAPENTLAAFAKAAEMKADGVELDVHLSKDGELMVSHDNSIARRSDGEGVIEEMTFDELRKYDFGKDFPLYAGEKMPTLAEVYDLLKPTVASYINVEIKGGSHGAIESLLVKLAEDMKMEDNIIYSCFSLEMLQAIKSLKPSAKIALLYGETVEGVTDYAAFAVANKLTALHPHFNAVLKTDLVAECRKAGIDVNPWTVNAEADMKTCYEKGIHAIITNYPDTARKVLEKM